jgi:putative endonuclease
MGLLSIRDMGRRNTAKRLDGWDFVRPIAHLFAVGDRLPAPWLLGKEETGRYGERVAADVLRRRGYRILVRNFRIRRSEVDLICRDGGTLVFIEVKTRRPGGRRRPLEQIRQGQKGRVRQAALRYVQLLGQRGIPLRFDVVEVLVTAGEPPVVQVLPGALQRENEG